MRSVKCEFGMWIFLVKSLVSRVSYTRCLLHIPFWCHFQHNRRKGRTYEERLCDLRTAWTSSGRGELVMGLENPGCRCLFVSMHVSEDWVHGVNSKFQERKLKKPHHRKMEASTVPRAPAFKREITQTERERARLMPPFPNHQSWFYRRSWMNAFMDNSTAKLISWLPTSMVSHATTIIIMDSSSGVNGDDFMFVSILTLIFISHVHIQLVASLLRNPWHPYLWKHLRATR